MNDTQSPEDGLGNASREENMSALFAGLVMQQTNLALMLLGKSPHPETQKTIQDIDGAKMFIDQLEMLEVKTQGNLRADEAKLLKQSLTVLRLAFVQAIDSPSPSTAAEQPKKPAAHAEPPESSIAPGQASTPPSEEEARKKFSKKY
jgi:hypothetical protein